MAALFIKFITECHSFYSENTVSVKLSDEFVNCKVMPVSVKCFLLLPC